MTLLQQAETLQQAAFARLILRRDATTISLKREEWQGNFDLITPRMPTLQGLLLACRQDAAIQRYLSEIPLVSGRVAYLGDPELHEALQDLANLIAMEASAAFRDAYYPGIPDISVHPKHVRRIMKALQREMDREAESRSRNGPARIPVRFLSLPVDRQRALAERRRYWHGQYGVTPRNWHRGVWSLWQVAAMPFPEGYVCK